MSRPPRITKAMGGQIGLRNGSVSDAHQSEAQTVEGSDHAVAAAAYSAERKGR
jgi:hypothetical protein